MNEKEVSEFMRKKYLAGSSGSNWTPNIQMTPEGLLTWGIPFAYYRAGDYSRFVMSLHDAQRGRAGIELREQFDKFEESLSMLQPTPQYFVESSAINSDFFYQELVSIVKG